MKVIIAGSRTINDYSLVASAIEQSNFDVTEVVCGDAKGVDTIGDQWAQKNTIPVTHFPANWKKFGRGAGCIRNRQMAEYGDALIAITTGSRGTANMIKEATKLGLKIFVLEVDPKK